MLKQTTLILQGRDKSLIVYLRIDITVLKEKGKHYQWPGLEVCPRCHKRRIWSHGYVFRYFFSGGRGVWCKRYRCVECRAVHTLRPLKHFRRFYYPWCTVILSLLTKLSTNRWLMGGASRQAQQYWWKGFIRHASRLSNPVLEKNTLNQLLRQHVFPATHSFIFFEIQIIRIALHRSFAVTYPHASG